VALETRGVNPHLALLLSDAYPGSLAPSHAEDLAKSGITEATRRLQRIRSVPPALFRPLLGRDVPEVTSAYVLPFADPRGGWVDHVRLRIFEPFRDARGRTVKYLAPPGVPPRLFFPLTTLSAACHGEAPVYIIEGCKKALAAAQLGLLAVGFEGIEGWHRRGTRELVPDFAALRLKDRRVELVPDADVHDNPNVARGAQRFAEALERRGARVRIVFLPQTLPGRAA
jgi:hypothetical protein